MVERNAFLAHQKHEYRVSQLGEHECSAPLKKEGRLLWNFVSFDRRTLTLRKMVEKKAFSFKPKKQFHVS